ncbi:MAG: hypothetical protein HYY96_05270 [Candidatus Tectomicrobia bacterium]|nr:hypothetical protein [Candidatus Tectomicrobia bacterium]
MRFLYRHWKIGIPGAMALVLLGLVAFGAFSPPRVESQGSLLDLFAPPPPTRDRFEPGRSQILAVGLDQPLVFVDRRYEITLLALIREGGTPIDRVEAFVVTDTGELLPFEELHRTDRRIDQDVIWRGQPFRFADVGLGETDLFGTDISLNIGNGTGDLLVAVFDVEGRAHFFPRLEFARAPQEPLPSGGGYDGYGTQYSSVFN